MMLTGDEEELSRVLDGLSVRARAAFAASCAERLIPGYVSHSEHIGMGNPGLLDEALDGLWQDLEGAVVPQAPFQRYVDLFSKLIANGQEPWRDGWPYAEDALMSTLHALRTRLTGDVQQAVWAARGAVESIHTYVSGPLSSTDPLYLMKVDTDPLMQAELRRQLVDLADLAKLPPSDGGSSNVISMIRERARTDALRFFDREAALKYLKTWT